MRPLQHSFAGQPVTCSLSIYEHAHPQSRCIDAALATENPEPSLLLERPHGRNEALINWTMWKHLVLQAAYQLIVLFLIIYGGPQRIEAYKLPSPCIPYSNVDGNVRPPLTASTSQNVVPATSTVFPLR